MVAFCFRSSGLLLPWLCAGLVAALLIVDGVHASGSQQQKQLRVVGNNRYLHDVTLISDSPSLVPSYFPSDAPSIVPSASPTTAPSDPPSDSPSNVPSLLSSSIPSDLPSAVPSPAPSASPSDVPSTYPSDLPSIVPSPTLSTIPSDGPSYVPSDVLSAIPSHVPSDVPSHVPSAAPSGIPSATPSGLSSDVPSQVPSVAPSGIPSDVPSQVPSVAPSAAPSNSPSGEPSAAPSGAPSDVPSGTPSDVPSSVPSPVSSTSPTLEESKYPSSYPSSFPSAEPSGTPTHAPTTGPSGTPSHVPSGMPTGTPSSVPSGMLTGTLSRVPPGMPEHVAVHALNLVVSADSIMDTATIALFEEECAALLPIFLAAINAAEFQFVECELLSQSLIDVPEGRRHLQQGERLVVLVRVSARANLPGSLSFNDLVGQVFGIFGSTLQSNLNSALPYYFGSTSTLGGTPVPAVEDVVTSSTRSNTGSEGKAEEVAVIPVVAAVVVGAVLAIGMAAFMLSVNRSRGDGTLPRHSTTDSVESSVEIEFVDDDDKTGTQFGESIMCESINASFLPATPIGMRSVADEIKSKSFAEPEYGHSPASSKSSASPYQYPGEQGSEVESASELESHHDSSSVSSYGAFLSSIASVMSGPSIMSEQGAYTGDGDPLGFAAERSLRAAERKTYEGKWDMTDEDKWDMGLLNRMCLGSPTDVAGSPVAADNETLATADPLAERTFLGFAMGGDVNPSEKKRRSFFGFATAGDYSCE
jgi:hypothetical protein